MMFPDPYKNAMDQDQIATFEAMAYKYLGEPEEDSTDKIVDEEEDNIVDNDADDYFDADDEDPEWFQKKFPNLK